MKDTRWETSSMASPIRWTTLTLDCSDAEALAAFYADLFGFEINARDGAGWVQARDPQVASV